VGEDDGVVERIATGTGRPDRVSIAVDTVGRFDGRYRRDERLVLGVVHPGRCEPRAVPYST